MNGVYGSLLLFTVGQRLVELLISKRNQRRLAARGFREVEPPADLRRMVALHTGWFVGLLGEPLLTGATPPPLLVAVGTGVFLTAQAIRVWAIGSLRGHWNISVYDPAGSAVPDQFVASGPYRFVRHPNYLAVILEFVSLPAVGGAYLTLVAGSVVNGLVLAKRVATEEAALMSRPGYAAVMGPKPRFIPNVLHTNRAEHSPG